jgi:hypothetical protein
MSPQPSRELRTELLRRLARSGTFLVFVGKLEQRIDEGRMSDALEILKEAGATSEVAWQIVDGWLEPGAELGPYPSRETASAVRLAHFIPRFDEADWPTILKRALRIEAARKSGESAQGDSGSAGGDAEG